MISNMATVKEINRGSELLKTLLNNQGLEAALVPYLEKYKEEDGREYQFQELLDYIQIFLKSDQITPEDLNKYKTIRGISPSILRERGKEICDTLIANNFNLSSLDDIAKKYAEEDKKYEPYTMPFLNRMRTFFLKSADADYLTLYREKQEMAKRGSIKEYNSETFKNLLELTNEEDILNLIHTEEITYENFLTLRNAYFSAHPEDEENKVRCAEIEKLLIKEKQEEIKKRALEASKIEAVRKHQERNDRLKQIIYTYLALGHDNLDECIRPAGLTTATFLNNIKEASLEDDDEELKELIRKYDELVEVYESKREELVYKIKDYYTNGIYYGYENRRFSLYEFYSLTDKGVPEIARSIRKYLPMAEGGRIINYLNNLTITRKFHDRDEFIGQLRNKYKGIERNEYEPIINYMEQMHWPYSLTLFKDIWERLADGLITLTVPDEKIEENMNK